MTSDEATFWRMEAERHATTPTEAHAMTITRDGCLYGWFCRSCNESGNGEAPAGSSYEQVWARARREHEAGQTAAREGR